MTSATREQKKLLYEQLIGQKLAGKFTITGLLGFGGMGAVYEAIQSPMDRKVALKLIPTYDPTAAARFEREAYTVSKLTHPNTVTVFDFGHTSDGHLYLSMEHLLGHTLTDLIRSVGPLNGARAVHITQQICRSLGEAHRQGIIHRDVKPDNIFLINVDGDPDYVKVLDFGIAKVAQRHLTLTGEIVGTPRFMPPEQACGEELDQRTDLYAAGMLLYCCLSGKAPFAGVQGPKVITLLVRGPTPLRELEPDLPPALLAVVDKAIAPEREKRFASAAAMAAALRASLVDPAPPAATAAPDAPPEPDEPRERRRTPMTLLMVALIVLAVVLGVGLTVFRHSLP